MAPTAAALSLDAAVGYSLAASLAYSPPAELRRGSGGYPQRLAPRLAFSQQVEVDRLRASATLLEMEEQDGVCVAFRGSTDLKNYLSMFNLFFEPSRLGTAKGGRVHRGYQEASLELCARLSPLLASRQPQRLAARAAECGDVDGRYDDRLALGAFILYTSRLECIPSLTLEAIVA